MRAPVSETSLDQVIVDYLQAQRGRAHLVLQAGREHDFSYGARVRIVIVAADSQTNAPMKGVEVSVLFKSTAEPHRLVLAEGVTGADDVSATRSCCRRTTAAPRRSSCRPSPSSGRRR